MRDTTSAPLHLTPDRYHVIGPEDFGSPGLWARESIGPWVSVRAVGALATVHDSRFDAHRGIGHHPHRGLERTFYILEGAVDHDDALNRITGHMGTGDLGILTEGRRGMIHSEWNNGGGPARAYILVMPTDPMPPVASFAAIRDGDAPRARPAPGVVTKQVVRRGDDRLHADLREFGDSAVDGGAALQLRFGPGEAGLAFVVDGALAAVENGSGELTLGREHTVVLPPAGQERSLRLVASERSRVLHAVTGPGLGFERA